MPLVATSTDRTFAHANLDILEMDATVQVQSIISEAFIFVLTVLMNFCLLLLVFLFVLKQPEIILMVALFRWINGWFLISSRCRWRPIFLKKHFALFMINITFQRLWVLNFVTFSFLYLLLHTLYIYLDLVGVLSFTYWRMQRGSCL